MQRGKRGRIRERKVDRVSWCFFIHIEVRFVEYKTRFMYLCFFFFTILNFVKMKNRKRNEREREGKVEREGGKKKRFK